MKSAEDQQELDPAVSPEPQSTDVQAKKEEPMLFCPVCNQRLTEHRCKLVCGRCGYFMSCADYY
jgi:ribosomal protein S27AE